MATLRPNSDPRVLIGKPLVLTVLTAGYLKEDLITGANYQYKTWTLSNNHHFGDRVGILICQEVTHDFAQMTLDRSV